jgi:putative aminopeptidase FrvX
MDLSALLIKLTKAHGISGYEGPVRELVRQEFAPYSHEVRVTKMGSVVGIRNGSGPAPRRKVMLSAHMDEIGLMVTGIEKGFLKITKVAGSDARVMLGQEVVVHGRRELPGLVASRPPHLLPPDERDQIIPFDKLFVDVGLPEAQVRRLVRVGPHLDPRRGVRAKRRAVFRQGARRPRGGGGGGRVPRGADLYAAPVGRDGCGVGARRDDLSRRGHQRLWPPPRRGDCD